MESVAVEDSHLSDLSNNNNNENISQKRKSMRSMANIHKKG